MARRQKEPLRLDYTPSAWRTVVHCAFSRIWLQDNVTQQLRVEPQGLQLQPKFEKRNSQCESRFSNFTFRFSTDRPCFPEAGALRLRSGQASGLGGVAGRYALHQLSVDQPRSSDNNGGEAHACSPATKSICPQESPWRATSLPHPRTPGRYRVCRLRQDALQSF